MLLIMTDEERYPPPYETAALAEFRRTQLPARERLRDGGLELHRHYAGSTACVPSRATLFTGQYPSLHGVAEDRRHRQEGDRPGDDLARPRRGADAGRLVPRRRLPDPLPGQVARLHADLSIPGTHESLMASDDDGRARSPTRSTAYRRADRLDPFGFSGWIGREPHGADKADCGHGARRRVRRAGRRAVRRAGATADDDGPWLAVASFVNPHDIAFAGGLDELLLGFAPIRRHRARDPRGAVAVRLVRRAARRARSSSRRCGRR